MKYFRPERTGQLIRDELSAMIARELEFPVGALVTVTDVTVTSDMDHAKVRISVLPGEFEERVMKILNDFRGFLQHGLYRKINIRPMPQMLFDLDHGLENAAAVEKSLLNDNTLLSEDKAP